MFIRLSSLAIVTLISVKLAVFATDDSRLWLVDPFERLEDRLGRLIDEIGRRRGEIREGAVRAFRLVVAVHGARRRAIECGRVAGGYLAACVRGVAQDAVRMAAGAGRPIFASCRVKAPIGKTPGVYSRCLTFPGRGIEVVLDSEGV